jgi:hypothetical protein
MQQASPGSPQWWQVSGPPPFGSHEVIGSHGASTPLLQQMALSVPQATHWLPAQVRLVPQPGVPAQQGSLACPQEAHTLLLQTVPLQQGWPPLVQELPCPTQSTHLSLGSQANVDDWHCGALGQQAMLSRPQATQDMAAPQVMNACESQLQATLQPFLSRPQ